MLKYGSEMQNVKNFIQGKALGVAEYLTPILKVISDGFCTAEQTFRTTL